MTTNGDLWSLLVPVKRLDVAKSRLTLPDDARADLALAMACDTVSAALVAEGVAEVVVITNDGRAGDALAALGARVVADAPDRGLNPALRHGASLASMPRLAAIASDLPALQPGDLAAVLTLAAEHPTAIVADISGSGTTVLAAHTSSGFAPVFGAGSRRAHVHAGATDLSTRAAASIRQDVDTLAALQDAVNLGVGRETARAFAHLQAGAP